MRRPWVWCLVALMSACKRPPTDVGTAPDTGPTGTHTGVPTDTDTDDPPPGRVWVEVSTHPCARDEDGWVECWNHPNGYDMGNASIPIPPSPFRVTSFSAPDASGVMGIHADGSRAGTAEGWFCGATWDSPFPDRQSPGFCDPDTTVQVRTLGHDSALGTDGLLYRWTNNGQASLVFPEGQVYRKFHAPWARMSLLTHDNLVYSDQGLMQQLYPPLVDAFDADLEIDEFVQAGIGVCGLDTTGTVTCLGPESPYHGLDEPVAFENPPYKRLRGGGWNACAQRLDDVIECSDGSTHDFGPLRDFAVHTFPTQDPDGPPDLPSPRNGLGVCAITTDNAIVCVGERYVPEIVEQLPVGDGLQPGQGSP